VNTGAGQACLFSIDTTTNLGSTVPGANSYTNQFNINIGTSFSAPIVSGIAGLMLSVNTNLKPTSLIARLKEGSSPYPTTSDNANVPTCHTPASSNDIQDQECVCTTAVCGAGMANALGAVNAALRPIADIAQTGALVAGSNLTLQGGGSTAANTHTIASYTWVKGGVTISSAPTANVVVPSTGTSTACLTVADETGKLDSAKIVINPTGSAITSVGASTNACATEVTVSASDASAAETGDTGTFTFTRTGDATAALTVSIAMTGTASNGTSYQTIANSFAFAAGATSATVTVTPIDNSVVDGSKTATVTIQSGSGYSIGSAASATVTISDNDVAANNANSGGGGGGGALDALVLMGLALAVLAMLFRAGRLPGYAKQLRQHISAEQRRARR
jgi:serine protease